MTIVRDAVTSLREEVRSELHSFYERMSTLIERSSAHSPPPPPHIATATPANPAPATDADSAPAPDAAFATAPGAAPATAPGAAPATAPGAASVVADASVPSPPPPPSYYSPPQAEKEADTPDGTANAAADTHAPTDASATDPPTDMVSFF